MFMYLIKRHGELELQHPTSEAEFEFEVEYEFGSESGVVSTKCECKES